MASLPGTLIALLAGGHVGGEWSGRTLKNLLAQHGRRSEVLAAKFLSLWLAGIGLIAVCWARSQSPARSSPARMASPTRRSTPTHKMGSFTVHSSLFVLAAFAAIGLLAAVLTRNTIGTWQPPRPRSSRCSSSRHSLAWADGHRRRGYKAGWDFRSDCARSPCYRTTSGRDSSAPGFPTQPPPRTQRYSSRSRRAVAVALRTFARSDIAG